MAILGSLRIRTVATLGNVVLAAAAVGCAIMALNATQILGDSLTYSVNNTATGLSELDAMRAGIGDARLWLTKSLLAGDAEQQRGYGEKVTDAMTRASDALDAYRPLIADPVEQGQYDRLQALWNDYKVQTRLVRAIPFSELERARTTYDTLINPRGVPLGNALDAEVAYKVSQAKTSGAAGKALTERYTLIAQLLIAALMAVAAGVILLFRHRLSGPLQRLTGAMDDMASGNLDRDIPGARLTDEIGDIGRALLAIKKSVAARADAVSDQQMAVQRQVAGALGEGLSALKDGRLTATIQQTFPGEYESLRRDFNEALASLADLMHQVTSSALSVRNGASEISAAASDLANRTEKQAASLEESSAAVRELNQSASSTAKTADDATRLAREAQASASESGDGMNRTVEAMNQIAGSSRQMEEIVSLIEGIAFQTNLLALNAGVEAARAGEAGRGFAVVATEVRALAQRSTDAAKDIGAIIKSSGRDVSQGVTLINQTQATLTQIVVSTQELSEMITHIAAASREQSVAIMQIDAVVSDMDRSTQQNAALVEQSSAAARSLSVEAASMTTLVEQFDLGRNSGGTGLRRAA